uniref:Uncharacterized protein n=1 Tax=Brassica oleracea var. oleracea TaxID=109376 RepID=A0A0D2ZT51_BRAOL
MNAPTLHLNLSIDQSRFIVQLASSFTAKDSLSLDHTYHYHVQICPRQLPLTPSCTQHLLDALLIPLLSPDLVHAPGGVQTLEEPYTCALLLHKHQMTPNGRDKVFRVVLICTGPYSPYGRPYGRP